MPGGMCRRRRKGWNTACARETRRVKDETVIAVAITTSRDGGDLLALRALRCSAALEEGAGKLFAAHAAWWRAFWEQSQVSVPDPAIQRYYTFARYLYGAGSRADAPPMPLQGVWTCATGSLPPWKGDYHSDLNTQMTYIAYQAAGNFNEGSSYLNYLWDKRDFWRSFAKDFYETPGLAVPGVMSLAGQPLGGWGAYSLSPTMTSWNAHLFYLHWLYTGDDAFMRDRAYPWCREAAECLKALLKPDPDGRLKLLRSSSPEIFGNCWLEPNTNYDNMSMQDAFPRGRGNGGRRKGSTQRPRHGATRLRNSGTTTQRPTTNSCSTPSVSCGNITATPPISWRSIRLISSRRKVRTWTANASPPR